MERTFNFKPERYYYTTPYEGEYVDKRNGIVCINPTADLDCYLNYISYLNMIRDKWKHYGYLDLGLMPLVMMPSFLVGSGMAGQLLAFAKKLNITCYTLPPVSLCYEKCSVAQNDIWVSKEDVARVLGCSLEEATLSRLLQRGA